MKKNNNRVRIIAGALRGRQLDFPDHDGLRPTGDRLRESLFSWLHQVLPGSCCLDMFAGSGALGFESVSRGASRVVMLETSKQVCRTLNKNVELLGISNLSVYCCDATSAFAKAEYEPHGPFDIVFIDPPFASGLQRIAINTLHQSQVLAPQALVSVESSKRDPIPAVPSHWTLHREKVAGEVRLQLYQLTE